MSLTSFVSRHRRKLYAVTGAVAVSYVAYSFLKSKLSDLQGQLVSDRTNKEKLRRRFAKNQADAELTIMALLPALCEHLERTFPVDETTRDLQSRRNVTATASTDTESVSSSTYTLLESTERKKTKKELWDDLKIQSLCRTVTLAYGLVLLTFFTRLQLNVLGRAAYVESVAQTLDGGAGGPQAEAQAARTLKVSEHYLNFSAWFLNWGVDRLCARVEEAVRDVFGTIQPRTELEADELAAALGAVYGHLDVVGNAAEFLLPTDADDVAVVMRLVPAVGDADLDVAADDPALRALLDETADLLESPQARRTLAGMTAAAFGLLDDALQRDFYFTVPASSTEVPPPPARPVPAGPEAGSENASAAGQDASAAVQSASPTASASAGRAKLASILAGVGRQAGQLALADQDLNLYFKAISEVPELAAFCAVVYSNY
ncbi:Peroxin-3 [Dipodascopsis tothii]|uniref:Peroxin-3 n=1 Tax=Dipodascopsis tothii TaxID=44089 RepID=UPI0034D00A12